VKQPARFLTNLDDTLCRLVVLILEFKMSKYENILAEATQWLTIPGVETIIPNPDDNSIMVVVSCSTLLLTNFIPEFYKGYVVNLHYVHGLNLSPKKKFDFNFPSINLLSTPT